MKNILKGNDTIDAARLAASYAANQMARSASSYTELNVCKYVDKGPHGNHTCWIFAVLEQFYSESLQPDSSAISKVQLDVLVCNMVRWYQPLWALYWRWCDIYHQIHNPTMVTFLPRAIQDQMFVYILVKWVMEGRLFSEASFTSIY